MTDVRDIHQRAMNLVDEAQLAKIRGEDHRYVELTTQALALESEAAWALMGDLALEPTRSILFRSAASLALEIQKPREAERLISAALAGTPPEEIADELRDLLEDVYFSRHLELRGITLSPGELQMTIDGNAIGFGIAKSDSFVQRLKDFEKLIFRTAERRMGRDFREQGRVIKKLTDSFELYLSVPRAASFAVTLRLGQSSQMGLPGVDFSTDTINDLLNALEAFAAGDDGALEDVIPDEVYRTNFIGLAERISPDGGQVKTVGFTVGNHSGERKVALTRTKSDIRKNKKENTPTPTTPEDDIEIVIVGTLLEADATRQKEGVIEIVDDSGTSHRVFVPRGMMSDIVKPMFEERVEVVAIIFDSKLKLVSIDTALGKDIEQLTQMGFEFDVLKPFPLS